MTAAAGRNGRSAVTGGETMRTVGVSITAALLVACVSTPSLCQGPSGSAVAGPVDSVVGELYATDSERVRRADSLLAAQDVDRYEIAVCVDPLRKWISGECTIRVTCEVDSLRLLLDEALSITSLKIESGAGLRHERNGVALAIDLRSAPPGSLCAFRIQYEGALASCDGSPFGRELVLLGADRHWYPAPPEHDTASFRIVVRYPEGYSSVATGSLVGMAPLREASRDPCVVGDVWVAATPIPAAAVVVGRFGSSLNVSGGLFLGYHWVDEPEGGAERTGPGSTPERSIKELVRFLESCFGPYPYEWLNVISVPEGVLGRASYVSAPGLVVIDEKTWGRPDASERCLDELGEGLSLTWWRYRLDAAPPVAFGLAGHAAVSWHEARGDEEEALRRREHWRAEYVRALGDLDGRARLLDCIGPDATGDDGACRAKAAAVFGVLERLIGKEVFCSALAELTASRGGRRIGLQDVVAAFEDSADRELGWFFYEWFCRGDLPTYRLDYEVVPGRTGTLVRGEIRQDGEIYRTPLPLTIELGGWSYEEWVTIQSSRQEFEIRAEMTPIDVVVDGDRLIPRIDGEELAAVHFQRGQRAAQADDWGTAVDEFGGAVSLARQSPPYLFHYGDALVHSGQLVAGLDALESAIELDPRNPEYRLALAQLYLGALEHERSLAHFDEYVRLREGPRGRLGRARALIGLGRIDEAFESVRRAEAEIDSLGDADGEREELFLVLGRLQEARGDSAAAVSEYEGALEVNPVSDEARRRLRALASGGR